MILKYFVLKNLKLIKKELRLTFINSLRVGWLKADGQLKALVSNILINNVNILFDEQGTPTLSEKRETDYFLGISVSYQAEYENELFSKCSDLFGFLKSQPMKNDKISFLRGLKIAELLSELNLQFDIHLLDLSNEELQATVKLYEEFSNIFRTKYRNVRRRPINQILYNQVLYHNLFMSISNYMEYHKITSKFSIHVDNWSFPNCDIKLNLSGHLLEQKNNDINQKFFPNVFTICDNIKLLKKDSNRKRFIDVVASIISRNFLDKSHQKYCDNILSTVFQNKKYDNSTSNITATTVQTLRLIMNDVARNGPLI